MEHPRHDDVDGLAGKSFFFDKIHPDALTGARAMAELAMHLVLHARRELEAQGSAAATDAVEAGGGDIGGSALDVPPPMIPGNYETLSDRCFIGTHFQGTIKAADGFEWLNDSRGRAPKYGYISKVPGSVLRIQVDTRASSSASGSASYSQASQGTDGPEGEVGSVAEEGGAGGRRLQRSNTNSHVADYVLVQLVHLKSYEGMGSAAVTCEVGCSCEESVIEGLEPSVRNSQLYLHSIYVSQSQDCVIAIRVRPGPKGRTKVKVSGIIVSEETGEIKGAAKTVEAVELVHTITLQHGGSFDVRQKTVGGRNSG